MKNIGFGVSYLFKNMLPFVVYIFLHIVVDCSFPICSLAQDKGCIQFIFTSDSHFGIKRPSFQGDTLVDADQVNIALVKKLNALTNLRLPMDGGVRAGKLVGGIDYLIHTGDIANRQESGIQPASVSWAQFQSVYLQGITLQNNQQHALQFLLLPGNHDVSNAIGYPKLLSPLKDNSSMVGIYHFMFPNIPLTGETFQFNQNKIHYSKNIGGMHFLFIQIWPDSSERVWIENDLKTVADSIPLLLFAHDPPSGDSRHFTNPNGSHSINSADKFENLLAEVFKDGNKVTDADVIEQREFETFVKKHTNIKVYFHGHENFNQFYQYKGPDNNIDLQTIRVDSPMKGNISRKDETKLSFQFVSIDTISKLLTVRECLWNTDPSRPDGPMQWGNTITIHLSVK